MLSLIKIRVRYIIRKPCLLFWTYLFLPIIILIAAIIVIMKKKEKTLKSFDPYVFNQRLKFFDDNDEYSNIKEGLKGTTFVVNDEKYCETIIPLLNAYGIAEDKCPLCTGRESNINNYTVNMIKLEKKKGKFNVEMTTRSIFFAPDIDFFLYSYNKMFYKKDDLTQNYIIDPYYTLDKSEWIRNNNPELPEFNVFFELQSFIAKIIIKLEGKDNIKDNFEMQMGYNKYPDSYLFANINDHITVPSSLLSFILTLQFSLIAYNINMRMIDEKESKLNILLERHGITYFKYMLSWLFTFIALFLFSIISFILLIYGEANGHIILFILNIILFTLALFSVCVLFTTCINTTKTGSTAIKFYNFSSIFIGFAIVLPKTLKFTKIFFAFIPQINYFMNHWTTYCFGNFKELSGDLVILRTAKMSYIETLVMYIVEIIFYLGLTWFIQSYKNSGLPFCLFLKSIFTKVSRNDNIKLINQEDDTLTEAKFEKNFQELSEINKHKFDNNQCLKLVKVSKNFDELKAVNNFTGELFSDEIFCLLGHNGAGKSTTINMISGVFPPDSGDIFLDGHSLVTNKDYLYSNLGLCQQEDIFFDYLTVEEHLEYMCQIKGSKVNHQEINELIAKIDLAQKKNALCSTLSGGQKRKLCIALALIGNSKIILLDEPTSGMDVMARRSLWEFLKNYKKDKIILLTTHFLDEAEYLGDRIGIMTDGQFICCGTSSYLKSKYPCGFNINLLINNNTFDESNKNKFFDQIIKYEPKAEIKIDSKYIFSINIQSNNKNIDEIFNYIEEVKTEFGIEDYTVGSTSLEDVFLKLNNKEIKNDKTKVNKHEILISSPKQRVKASSFCTQLGAHIIRNLYPLYRNKALFFFELLSGLGIVYIFIFFFSDFFSESMTTTLNLIEVLESNKIYYSTKNTGKKFLKNSDTYDSYGTYISLSDLETDTEDINIFMDIAYDEALAHIAKGSLNIKKEARTDAYNNKYSYYTVFNTEVNTDLYGYLYANTMLFVSAFLKESYNIDATILRKISFKEGSEEENKLSDVLNDSIILIIVCLINFFGFVVFLGGLMLEKIKEKRTNIKHLLYLSGNNIVSYWLGFYITDYIKLLFFTILLVAPVYYVNGCATYFGLDMLIINISSLSFIYFISFFCSKDDSGSKALFIFVFGFVIIMVLIIIAFPDDLDKIFNLTKPYTPTIFDITPVTSMVFSFIRLILSYTFIHEIEKNFNGDYSAQESNGFKRPENYLYTSYIAQLINIVFYSLLLILAESGLLSKLSNCIDNKLYGEKNDAPLQNNQMIINQDKNDMINSNVNVNINNINNINNQGNVRIYSDLINNNNININPQSLYFNFNNGQNSSKNPLENPYVQSEIRKVNNGNIELSTRIIDLNKTFYPCCACCRKGKVKAINHLHLGLEPNQKFGLLGFNGSGKTTTFRSITNEILFDSGSINLFGCDTKYDFENIRNSIGYCPQINPLFDFMKVREIINFYSKLKTFNESPEIVCEKFGLSKYLDTYTINLSGGNKRKLTFALALMNKPSLLLLDEPSTGVDPESRRIMWKNINELNEKGHKYNMILTTHSMEEAEILCDTVSWMREGNFITLGNPEELKLKYSAGYNLHIKFNNSNINSIQKNNIEQCIVILSDLIIGFNQVSNFFRQNPNYKPYLNSLINVINSIKDKTEKISLLLIGQDFSFELVIKIKNEMKKELFTNILNMKNINNTIDELTISMQSLENILTSI